MENNNTNVSNDITKIFTTNSALKNNTKDENSKINCTNTKNINDLNTDEKKIPKMDENLNKLLKKWVKYDEDINNLENKLQSLKQNKRKITPYLEDFMKKENLNKIIINKDYYLVIKDKEYYYPINRTYIEKSLKNLIDESEKREKIVNYLYNNRDIIYKKNLEIKHNE